MRFKLIVSVLLLGMLGSTDSYAEEIIISKSNLKFPVSAQHIAELAAANMQLFSRFPDQVERFGPVDFQSAYVASVVGKGDLKYILVGFSMKKMTEGNSMTYMTVIQYCDNERNYEFVTQGLIPENIEKVYNEFIDSNNKSLTQLEDACYRHNIVD